MSRVRSVLAVVLTLALVVPTALLYLDLRRDTRDAIDRTGLERRALEYLGHLTPVLGALTEAQSTALRGRTGELPALAGAVEKVTEADRRYGAELGVHERWTTLREKLGTLDERGGAPLPVLQAHVEAGDLLLALYDAVRDASGLQRDADSDISHLQQVAAVDLPRAVVFGTRSADLALLASAANGPEQQQLAAGLAAASAGTSAAVDDLTENLQRASDDTASTTLSSSVMGTLDTFRRAVEAITLGTTGGGRGADAGRLATAYTDLRQGLTALATTVQAETDKLLAARADDRRDAQRRQDVIVACAALVAVVLLLVLTVGRRRTRPAGEPGATLSAGPMAGDTPTPTPRERTGALR
jgi:hypothetical protein